LELLRKAGIPSEALPDKKPAKLSKITARDYLAEIACRQSFCRKVLTQPRPKAGILRVGPGNSFVARPRDCGYRPSVAGTLKGTLRSAITF
jgi:hypothetical protein